MSISRRLRRSSLQSRLSVDNGSFSPSPLNADVIRNGSTLFEEDEDDSGDYSPISGVKRMANAYERTPELGDEPEPLKQQWTGGSSTSDVWRRWEDMGLGGRRKRRESERSLGAGNMADEDVSPAGRSAVLSSGEEADVDTPGIEEEGDEEVGGTVKGPPMGLGLGLAVGSSSGGEASGTDTSPPPPYRSPNLEVSPAHLSVPLAESTDTPPSRRRLSVTPTPDRTRGLDMQPSPTPTREMTSDPILPSRDTSSPHVSESPDPYAALRQSSPSGRIRSTRRLPKDLQTNLGPGKEDSPSSRRVTIRPNRADSLFNPPSPQLKSPREAELEAQLLQLVDRVKELECKLDKVASVPSSSLGREMVRPISPVGLLPDSILVRLGLVPEREGLPTRVRELPGYLFLVGVGVGAVVVRALMRRR